MLVSREGVCAGILVPRHEAVKMNDTFALSARLGFLSSWPVLACVCSLDGKTRQTDQEPVE